MFKFWLTFFIDIINPLFHLLSLHVTSCVCNMQLIDFYIVYSKYLLFL